MAKTDIYDVEGSESDIFSERGAYEVRVVTITSQQCVRAEVYLPTSSPIHLL